MDQRSRILAAIAAQEELRATGRVAGNPAQIGHAWRVLGMAASRSVGPIDVDDKAITATKCFERALDSFEASELDRALVLLAWAAAIRTSHRDRATSIHDGALGILRDLGLESLVDRAVDPAVTSFGRRTAAPPGHADEGSLRHRRLPTSWRPVSKRGGGDLQRLMIGTST